MVVQYSYKDSKKIHLLVTGGFKLANDTYPVKDRLFYKSNRQ